MSANIMVSSGSAARSFRRFVDGVVTPDRCLAAFHLQRTRFQLIAERKLRNRQLTADGNLEINGRDMRALSLGTSAAHVPALADGMPGRSSVMITEAERRFPVRIRIAADQGLGARFNQIRPMA